MSEILESLYEIASKREPIYRRFSSYSGSDRNDEIGNHSTVSLEQSDNEVYARRRTLSSSLPYEQRREGEDWSSLPSLGDYERRPVADSVNHNFGSHFLSQKYESLDYDECENLLFLEEQKSSVHSRFNWKEKVRWIIIFMIGVLTALTATFIVILVEVLSRFKYETLQSFVEKCSPNSSRFCMLYPYLLWLVLNGFPVLLGSLLVTYIAPVAAGSGIPVIKCYLNGVKIPEVVRIKTYFAKAIGVVLSVVGGLACGKEGPMIHCGAVIAAGISQGKSSTMDMDSKLLQGFRVDREKRDFVSAGAAAGVASAFGAPVGGVLFSLEEGASFWNQSLTWRIFFCSMVSTFTLNLVLSTYHSHPGQLSYAGLLNFGKFNDSDFSYNFGELFLYMIMGAIGGVLGALFNFLNHMLTIFRIRYLYKRWVKVLEAVFVSIMTATVGFLMIIYIHDCHEKIEQNTVEYPIQYNCKDGDYSVMGALFFNTPEATLRNLFHNVNGTWSPWSLCIFVTFYFLLACWTYGLSISSGLFIPSLLVGAAWGRLFGIFINYIFPDQVWVYPGKFALIGAAATLGGIVRMTISLTVILIEASGNLTFGLPIMITLIVAKWVGDYFNEGLYDIHIHLSSVPFLNWEPPTSSYNVYASEIMSSPVTTFKTTEKVNRIIDVLVNQSHNGFPVVDMLPLVDSDSLQESSSCTTDIGQSKTYGRFRGLVLRWQLIIMLKNKIFNEYCQNWDAFNLSTFRDAYPRYPSVESVISNITDEERNYSIDLRPLMNPSAYSVTHTASLTRIFRLFRALGLRHLVVINDRNEVIGIVTRKDIARYKDHWNSGKYSIQEMQISHN